ncbi:conserved hypothetical protein [Magnetospirillum sp. UT-4]|nr:conserved hypothetical protein [Magnetospirillum sp. UT-4]
MGDECTGSVIPGYHARALECTTRIAYMWTADDIAITLLDDLTDDPIVTAEIRTPDGVLRVMARVEGEGPTLRLCELHMHGVNVGLRQFGHQRLFALIWAVMQTLEGTDEIVIEGAVRTSGAGKGHRPRPQRYTREALHRHFHPSPRHPGGGPLVGEEAHADGAGTPAPDPFAP